MNGQLELRIITSLIQQYIGDTFAVYFLEIH